ncbi:phosphoribosylformylglycinamidine synthase [candidate division KSB1 bacterium]|nr:MAG: phosphoribosylformylglycinamidine synthase [candidate division KSB1 bacterium]
MAYRIEVIYKNNVLDPTGEGVKKSIKNFLHLGVDSVKTKQVYTIDAELTPEELELVKEEIFTDPVIQESSIGQFYFTDFDWLIEVGFKPGVTDNVGKTSKIAIEDVIRRKLKKEEGVYTSTQYLFRGGNLKERDIIRIANEFLSNSLIHRITVMSREKWFQQGISVEIPKIKGKQDVKVMEFDLNIPDDKLMALNRERTLALNLNELYVIRDYFKNPEVVKERKKFDLSDKPTDVELEAIAQTWSEHCKHKIFNSFITYKDSEKTIHINSLFNSYIKKATEEIGKEKDWLVSVFHDNAGVIKFNEKYNLVYKVETHNSPSALEPYGGAITGIVGVNRDPMGTGLGAELLINVWGYCFGSPFYDRKIPEGLLHPMRIREGVHKGVIDGGNQSGIPYGRGWEFFDERYIGKPLVFCGTVGLLPQKIKGKPSHIKTVDPGDLIIMAGGKIGKDGIHGATFSSEELHKDSPVQAVQIGDPITQKKMYDFLIEARNLGLYKCITDNGAGGLSSSVGEMAQFSNGCELHLEKAPLKYEGLQPWEILLSEAQERMTLAVSPDKMDEFLKLAEKREVEVTILGKFTDSGKFHVLYDNKTVAYIDIDFFHNGLPRMKLEAKWERKKFDEPQLPDSIDIGTVMKDMLGRLNICSNETKCRIYDHEVKGLSVIKPFIGVEGDTPADAVIFMPEPGARDGIVLAEGKNPSYSDIDTYYMVASAIDEAIRRIISAGGNPEYIAGLDNFCWPDPVQSEKTPDGHYKLAQLVRANMALYDYCKAFKVPCISGKDSMKNDSIFEGKKISIPPTLLFSAAGKIEDYSKAVTLDVKKPGDLIYVLGKTYDETGASEYFRYIGEKLRGKPYIGNKIPKVNAQSAFKLYKKLNQAIKKELLRSSHTPVLGGLGIGFAKIAFGGNLGIEIDLSKVPRKDISRDDIILFSESNSRFIVTVAPDKKSEFEKIMEDVDYAEVGKVIPEKKIKIKGLNGNIILDEEISILKECWKKTFKEL